MPKSRPWLPILVIGISLLAAAVFFLNRDLASSFVRPGAASSLWFRSQTNTTIEVEAAEDDEDLEIEEALPPEADPGVVGFEANASRSAKVGEGEGSEGVAADAAKGQIVAAVGFGCDFFSGKWIRDESYPLFQPFACPFVDEAFRCQENGRPDSEYLKWRWQPNDCDLLRFNATDMLRRLKHKRLVFIGDSIGRNQWESLVCMLYQSVSNRKNVFETRHQSINKLRGNYAIRFADYDVQIEYYRTHFLVKEGKRPAGATSRRIRSSLKLDRVDNKGGKWNKGNIYVFNTGHWWDHSKVKKGKCYFVEGSNFTTSMDVLTAYEKALRTWSRWVESHVSVQNAIVFFRGFAPNHFSGGEWNTGGNCGDKLPVSEESKLGKLPDKVQVQDKVIRDMRRPVIFLNVTRLTQFRSDGHVGTWGQVLSPGQKPRQDCSHWCLPGVPDTWNQLLYASLLQHQT